MKVIWHTMMLLLCPLTTIGMNKEPISEKLKKVLVAQKTLKNENATLKEIISTIINCIEGSPSIPTDVKYQLLDILQPNNATNNTN